MRNSDDEFFLLQSLDTALDYIKNGKHEAACGLWEVFIELKNHPEVGPLLTPEVNRKIDELHRKIRKWNESKTLKFH